MSNKAIFAVLSVFTLAAAVAHPAMAATFISDEREVTTITEPITDDLYVFGNVISIESSVAGDVTTAGRTVEITGTTEQDIYAAGQSVTIEGSAGDDVHAAGETVRISSDISGDVFVAGQSMTLTQDSAVGEDLYAAGADVTLAGQVAGNVRAAGEQVVIKSTARIAGDVEVASDNDPIVEDGAVIGGELKRIRTEIKPEVAPTFQSQLAGWVRQVISLFVIALILLLVFPRATQHLMGLMKDSPLKRFGVGLLWVLLFIPAVILLFISIIGWSIAFVVIAGTVIAAMVAGGLAALTIGQWLMRKTSPNTPANLTWAHALLGAVAFQTIQLVPVIGPLVTAVIALIALGAIARALIPQRSENTAAKV